MEADIEGLLNAAIGRVLSWPFKAEPASVVDRDGTRTYRFASVVYTVQEGSAPLDRDIPSDNTAAVIDASGNMDLEGFRAAYEHVALAKRLRKSPAPRLDGVASTTTTLGVIFAQRSACPLEDFAEDLQRLNSRTPNREWPDMVVVGSTGIINYAVQFPGESISGDYLPPGEGSLDAFVPPMYVAIIMRPAGDYKFNRMISFLVAHLAFFSPGATLPNFKHIVEGCPQTAIVVSGYQYNLRGDLLPVPRQFYNDRYIPPLPMRIEGQNGELLCTIQYIPWQDGGVLLLEGRMPLDGIMIFLEREALQKAGVVRRPRDVQISYVLPITQSNFSEMLNRLQRQSNLIVRPTQPNWTVQKIADEGTATPFIVRLFMGMVRLRDAAYTEPVTRDEFDKRFDVVSSSLMNARATVKEIKTLWETHSRKINSGEIARMSGTIVQVDESIDKEFKREVETFLNAAVRALKQGMQNLANEMQLNIGFLFKQQAAFEAGIATLQLKDPLLAEYLRQTRMWSERLIQSRNDVEHNGWKLPRVGYKDTGSGVAATEPLISGQPVTDFVDFMLDRLCCFVEEFTAHCLQRLLPTGITVTEIPLARRVVAAPERFALTLGAGGLLPWQIAYHTSLFDET